MTKIQLTRQLRISESKVLSAGTMLTFVGYECTSDNIDIRNIPTIALEYLHIIGNENEVEASIRLKPAKSANQIDIWINNTIIGRLVSDELNREELPEPGYNVIAKPLYLQDIEGKTVHTFGDEKETEDTDANDENIDTKEDANNKAKFAKDSDILKKIQEKLITPENQAPANDVTREGLESKMSEISTSYMHASNSGLMINYPNLTKDSVLSVFENTILAEYVYSLCYLLRRMLGYWPTVSTDTEERIAIYDKDNDFNIGINFTEKTINLGLDYKAKRFAATITQYIKQHPIALTIVTNAYSKV